MLRISAGRSVSCRVAGGTAIALGYGALGGFSRSAEAHGISEASSQTMAHGGVLDYIWLGAEHMVTGYDHLLFLFGVIFFLTGFRDVVRFITAFTLGHCITLLGATLAGVTANAYLIDAVIALSVIYKGFENLGGFEKTLEIKPPNLLTMVFVFGLIHGFGLSTRLQELPLGDEGLVSRILAFNVGVELGQVAALALMLGFFKLWRTSSTFQRFSNIANGLLVLVGACLFLYQMNGYKQERKLTATAVEHGHHDDGHHDDGHHDDGHHDGGHHDDGHHDDGHHDEPHHDDVKPDDSNPDEAEPPAPAPEKTTTHSHGSGGEHSH